LPGLSSGKEPQPVFLWTDESGRQQGSGDASCSSLLLLSWRPLPTPVDHGERGEDGSAPTFVARGGAHHRPLAFREDRTLKMTVSLPMSAPLTTHPAKMAPDLPEARPQSSNRETSSNAFAWLRPVKKIEQESHRTLAIREVQSPKLLVCCSRYQMFNRYATTFFQCLILIGEPEYG
jgi:hypothetical protein